ncbi:nickel pincer cofactor biosynthesis protein LarC [Clostridia bacterium OttesenSCG-928-O13]|nr:nickel pincer cofactor biosynthesis protein LarC [Clostridia bacterium OttesenSCG-928-O13]
MKTLYIECNMGAAGDMLTGALLELLPDPDAFVAHINSWGVPGVQVRRAPATKCGIVGTHVSVMINGEEELCEDVAAGHTHPDGEEPSGHGHSHFHAGHSHQHSHAAHTHAHGDGAAPHSHTGMGEIESIIKALPVSEKVKADALAVYTLVAEAEAACHGTTADCVHFHEVGMMDAVADIVAVCALMEAIGPQRVVASPIHVGSGQVRCSHGILPVPTPATARILLGIPSYGGEIKGELCTPTGAALLRHFAGEFGPMPLMTVDAIGYGMGTKDFPLANCVRVFLGQAQNEAPGVVEVCCNLDDMTGEDIAFAAETLLAAGALDVYTIALQMKKGRPGHMLCCLCRPDQKETMTGLLLRHTTTLGVRSHPWQRHVLGREETTAQTPWGPVGVKHASGCGAGKAKPEYEDVAHIAKEQGLSLAEVREGIEKQK